MPQATLISANYSRLIAREIGVRERGLRRFLQGVNISPDAFMEGDCQLTLAQQNTLSMNALAISGDPGLGLRLGRLLSPETYGPVGFLVSMSPSLGVAIEHFKTFLPSRIPYVTLDTRIDGQWLICRLKVSFDDESLLYASAIESISLSLLSIIRSMVGDDVHACKQLCRYAAPDYVARYADYFSIPVQFNAIESSVCLPVALAAASNPNANNANYSMAISLCDGMLSDLSKLQVSTRNRVKALLLSAPPGLMGERAVAESLFVSTRTLVRRLSEEHTRFRDVRDEVLAEIAVSHLMNSTESVESIAALLNYHDASNFRRAFKKWQGCTPDQYRRLNSDNNTL